MLRTSGFDDDVMFVHNRRGEGNANRAYTQSDSPGAEMGAKSDVQDCLVFDSVINGFWTNHVRDVYNERYDSRQCS